MDAADAKVVGHRLNEPLDDLLGREPAEVLEVASPDVPDVGVLNLLRGRESAESRVRPVFDVPPSVITDHSLASAVVSERARVARQQIERVNRAILGEESSQLGHYHQGFDLRVGV
jgi:hypothetical protein